MTVTAIVAVKVVVAAMKAMVATGMVTALVVMMIGCGA